MPQPPHPSALRTKITLAATSLLLTATIALPNPPPSPNPTASPAPSTSPTPATSPAPTAPTIAPGDSLAITIFELVTPGQYYATTITVDDHGDISIPPLKKIHAQGLTPAQLESLISKTAIPPAISLQPPKDTPGPEVTVKLLNHSPR